MRNLYGLMALIMGWGGMYGITHEQGAIGLLLMVAMGISIYKGQLGSWLRHRRTPLWRIGKKLGKIITGWKTPAPKFGTVS